jgi:hypothetical protein
MACRDVQVAASKSSFDGMGMRNCFFGRVAGLRGAEERLWIYESALPYLDLDRFSNCPKLILSRALRLSFLRSISILERSRDAQS